MKKFWIGLLSLLGATLSAALCFLFLLADGLAGMEVGSYHDSGAKLWSIMAFFVAIGLAINGLCWLVSFIVDKSKGKPAK